MFEGLVNGEIYTLNGSRYLLFEVPFENEINDLDDYLFRLINKGVIPVLAHPERYAFLQKDPERVVHLMNMGVLLQGNFASVTKRYGRHAYKLFKYYLKKGYFTFLGSDVHHGNGSFYDNYPKMAKKITRIIGKDKFIELTFTNPMKFFKD